METVMEYTLDEFIVTVADTMGVLIKLEGMIESGWAMARFDMSFQEFLKTDRQMPIANALLKKAEEKPKEQCAAEVEKIQNTILRRYLASHRVLQPDPELPKRNCNLLYYALMGDTPEESKAVHYAGDVSDRSIPAQSIFKLVPPDAVLCWIYKVREDGSYERIYFPPSSLTALGVQ